MSTPASQHQTVASRLTGSPEFHQARDQLLAVVGRSSSEIDGVRPGTSPELLTRYQETLGQFQKDRGLSVTGTIDKATMAALDKAAPAPGSQAVLYPDYDKLFADGADQAQLLAAPDQQAAVLCAQFAGRVGHTSTRSMPPLLARATYSGIQFSPRICLAISMTM